VSFLIKEGVVFPHEVLPEMWRAINIAVDECVQVPVMTSFFRFDDQRLHGAALAVDFDCARDVDLALGLAWASVVQARLGADYDVLWHDAGSGYHLHIEFEGRRVPPYSAGFHWRISRTMEI